MNKFNLLHQYSLEFLKNIWNWQRARLKYFHIALYISILFILLLVVSFFFIIFFETNITIYSWLWCFTNRTNRWINERTNEHSFKQMNKRNSATFKYLCNIKQPLRLFWLEVVGGDARLISYFKNSFPHIFIIIFIIDNIIIIVIIIVIVGYV